MTMTAALIGGTIVSGLVSAAGAISSANASAAAAKRDAAISERNKILADQDRQQAVRTADIAAEDKRRENRRLLATMKASYGSTGLELTGSPLDVLADTSEEMALDERRISYEGKVKNREGALQMLYLQEDADSSRMKAKTYKRAGMLSAVSSLVDAGVSAGKIKAGY